MIHETSIIDPSAKIGNNVVIGPYCIVEKNTIIDDHTVLKNHVIIRSDTHIGKNNTFFQFSSVGEIPQDLKFKGEKSLCTIGDNNIIREYCSIHKGTKDGINETRIGDNNLLMAYTHIAHDCIINDNCILSNAASLAGHVTLESNVSLGGFTLVHQFCRIGSYSFSGLGTVISQDVTPFTLVAGNHAKAYKINSEGLKRKNFDIDTIKNLEKIFKIFIKSNKPIEERLNSYKKLKLNDKNVKYFVDFITTSKRGITR